MLFIVTFLRLKKLRPSSTTYSSVLVKIFKEILYFSRKWRYLALIAPALSYEKRIKIMLNITLIKKCFSPLRKISSDSDDVFTSKQAGPGYVTVCSKTSNKSNGKLSFWSWKFEKKIRKKIQKICKIRQFRVWRMSWSDVWCLNVSGRRRTVQADQAATASRTMISSGQTTPRPSHDWPKGFWVKIFDTVVNTLG